MPKLQVNKKLERFLTTPKQIKVAIGGRGCVRRDTLIDTPQGQVRIDEFKGGEVFATSSKGITIVNACAPIEYPEEQLYKIKLENGQTLSCTDQHRFLTSHGWRSLAALQHEKLPLCVSYPHHSISVPYLSESPLDAQHLTQKLLGYLYHYWLCHHQCGPQLPTVEDTYLYVLQRLSDGQLHKSHALFREGGQVSSYRHTPSLVLSHLSNLLFLLEEEVQSFEGKGSHTFYKSFEQLLELSQAPQLSHESNTLEKLAQPLSTLFLECVSERHQGQSFQIVADIIQHDVNDESYSNLLGCNLDLHYSPIESIEKDVIDNYYDFFVPLFNNYLSNGIVNHNSGKSIGFGDMLTMKMATEKADIYCLREFQDSIADSVHRVFEDSISARLKLEGWTIQRDAIISPQGARTVYKGAARNPNSIQSAQGFKYSWFEEAHTISQETLDKLLPTILRNPGAECWFSANPQSQADPFSQRFINPFKKYLDRDGYFEDDMHLVVVINWRDNPWWNDSADALRRRDKQELTRAKYDWIWEGHFNDEVENSIIKAEWFDAAVDAHKIDKYQEFFKPRGVVIAAHDPSDKGDDEAGLAIRHGSVITQVRAKGNGEIDTKCDWAMNLALDDRVDWFVWDGDGMGTGLKRQVHDMFAGKRIDYHMFKGSLSGSGQDNADIIYDKQSRQSGEKQYTYKDTFKNNRAQYYSELARRFYNTYKLVEHGVYCDVDECISIDSNGVDSIASLRSELCRIPSKHGHGGLIQIMNKQEMKKEGISSPNMGDSVMMTMWNPPAKRKNSALDFIHHQTQAQDYDPYGY